MLQKSRTVQARQIKSNNKFIFYFEKYENSESQKIYKYVRVMLTKKIDTTEAV